MARGKKILPESSDEDYYSDSSMSEELDIGEVWDELSSSIDKKDPNEIKIALLNFCDAIEPIALDIENANMFTDSLTKLYEERNIIVDLLKNETYNEFFDSIFEAISLLFISTKHIKKHIPKEEYKPILDSVLKELEKMGKEELANNDKMDVSKKKNEKAKLMRNIGNKHGGDESSDGEEEEEEEEKLVMEVITSSLDLLITSGQRTDVIWLYNEVYRANILDNNWNYATINMMGGFFRAFWGNDYEDIKNNYCVSLIIDDLISLGEYIISDNDIPQNVVDSGIKIVTAFVTTFILQLRKDDGKKIIEMVLKMLHSPIISSNIERKSILSGFIGEISDSYCIWLEHYKDDFFVEFSREALNINVNNDTKSAFGDLVKATFLLIDRNNKTQLEIAMKLLMKCFDIIEFAPVSDEDKDIRYCQGFLESLLDSVSQYFVKTPYNEEASKRFLNILKINNIKYPRRVSEKTAATLLLELCGGFLKNINLELAKLYLEITFTTMPEIIGKILINILVKIPQGSNCLNETSVTFKSIINYSRYLSEASKVYKDDASALSLKLASLAIEKAGLISWSDSSNINVKNEWTNIRQIIDIASAGGNNCSCCGEGECECDDEDDIDEDSMDAAMKSLIKVTLKNEVVPISQATMLLVKMKVPKMKKFETFSEIIRNLKIFSYIYLTCAKLDLSLESNFFETNIYFFLNEAIKAFKEEYNQLDKEMKRLSKKEYDLLMESGEMKDMFTQFNYEAENIFDFMCILLQKMVKTKEIISESKKSQIDHDMEMLDRLIKNVLEHLVTDKSGAISIFSYISGSESIPLTFSSFKFAIEHLPISEKDFSEEKYTTYSERLVDIIECLGSIIENNISHEEKYREEFKVLIDKYINVVQNDSSVLEYTDGQRLTHFPIVLDKLRKGENINELWPDVLLELSNLKSVLPFLKVGSLLNSLPDDKKEPLRALPSKDTFVDILKHSIKEVDVLTQKKYKEAANETEKLLAFMI